jgi:SNF2 family DNA or RNA helicase
MTGTPIQNRISDLISYFKILNFHSYSIDIKLNKNKFPS